MRQTVRTLNLGAFAWYSALAWICSRDRELTRKVHQLLIDDPSRSSAEKITERELKEWSTSTHKVLLTTLYDADDDLDFALRNGAIRATGQEASEMQADRRREILPSEWAHREFDHRGLHDDMWQDVFEGPAPKGPAQCKFKRVRVNEADVLARWHERPSDLLEVMDGSTWSLEQVVYWVTHGTHRGFPGRGLKIGDGVRQAILDKLRYGSLTATCAKRTSGNKIINDGASSPDERVVLNSEQWAGHTFADYRALEFPSEKVRQIWPLRDRDWVDQFQSQAEYIQHAMTHRKLTSREAREEAKRAQIRHGKPGPRGNRSKNSIQPNKN